MQKPYRITGSGQITNKFAFNRSAASLVRQKVNNPKNNSHKVAMLIIEASNKIYKPKLYDKAINNPIYSYQ